MAQTLAERAMQTAVFFWVAKLIGPGAFGVAAIAIAPTAIFVTIINGARFSVIQRADMTASFLASSFGFSLVCGLVLSLATVGLAPLLAAMYHDFDMRNMILLTAIVPVVASLGVVSEGLLIRRFEFRTLAVRRILGVAIASIGCVWAAVHGAGPWSMVVQSVLSTSVMSLAALATGRWRPSLRGSWIDLRATARFSLSVCSANALTQANIRLSEVIVGYFAGPVAAGIFRLGRTLIDLVMSLAMDPFFNVLLPYFSRSDGESEEAWKRLAQVVMLSVMAFSVVGFAVAVFAPLVPALILGAQWKAVAPVLAMLAVSLPTMGLINPVQIYAVSRGNPGYNLRINLLQVGLNLLMVAVGGKLFDALGSAAGFSARAILVYGIVYLLVARWLPSVAKLFTPSILLLPAIMLVAPIWVIWLANETSLGLLAQTALSAIATAVFLWLTLHIGASVISTSFIHQKGALASSPMQLVIKSFRRFFPRGVRG
jgi:O-antigen/teichoic acid export membrane protein